MSSSNREFVFLGCAPSYLADITYPFSIIVSEVIDDKCTLTSYVLNGWQNIREFFPDEIREDVLFFLDSLGDYRPGFEAERFLAHLRTLSIGPIRFIEAGTTTREKLDESLAALFTDGLTPVIWPESFKLVQHNE